MVELVIRLVFSLAVVIGMLMLITRFSAKRFRGGTDALVRVVHRQPLSRTSAVAVVTVGSRVLVVGTTEHQVQLLTELGPGEIELPAALPVAPLAAVRSEASALSEAPSLSGAWAEPEFCGLDALFGEEEPAVAKVVDAGYAPRHAGRKRSLSRATAATRAADGALAGSVLSAQTWKQAFAAATARSRDAS